MDVKYRYITQDVDRNGNVRLYLRRPGRPKIRLHSPPGSLEFAAEYETALKSLSAMNSQQPVVSTITNSQPNTWRWLCEQYFGSAEFSLLEPSTQRVRRRILEATFDEPRAPGAKEVFANCPIQRMSPLAVRILRDRKLEHVSAANNRLKAIHRVFSWATSLEPPLASTNPARDINKIRQSSQGHHSWTMEEVDQFLLRHECGSMARLALYLLLYTGQRRSDVVRFGPQHIRNGWLRFTQFKNRNRSPVTLEIPVLPILQNEIDRAKVDHLTFLVTKWGKPFSVAGFGNKFREWCDQANLKHCSAHGLRKAGAVTAAENGATAHQLMSIFGWKTLNEAERYTKGAEQRRLAGEAMQLLVRNRT